MSVLTAVRHGQASFFAEDYDKLSSLGEQQSRLLGEYWAQRKFQFHEVYCGPRSRQRQTAALAGDVCRQAGLPWPEPVVVPDLDEYDLSGIMDRLAPRLAEKNERFAALAERHKSSVEERDRLRHFQAMFEVLLAHWQTSEAADDVMETWQSFRERVGRAIRQIQSFPGNGRRVALFTSGGFIGAAAQRALGAPDRTALELNWRVRNAALTEFIFTSERLTLDSFNGLPHLQDPALWTYR